MKINHIFLHVVLGLLTSQTFCIYLGQGLAAEPSPPAIFIIGINPYQHQQVVSDSSTCPQQQCRFTFPAVPEGQRLVITHVSGQIGPAQVVVLETGPALAQTTLFVPKANSSIGYVGAQVTFYVNSGESPRARIFYPNSTDTNSLIVDLVGHLVSQQ
jgi:hypothetical protein